MGATLDTRRATANVYIDDDETQANPGSGSNSGNTNNQPTTTPTSTALPTISLTDTRLAEGNSGASLATLTLQLSAPSSQIVSVSYSTLDGTATAGSDYLTSGNTVTFAPGQTVATLQIPVLGDTEVETDEYFRLMLSNPVNATLFTGTGTSTGMASVYLSNDDLPSLSISPATQAEGNTPAGFIELTINLSAASSRTVSVNYQTLDGTATGGSDYLVRSGEISFLPGQTRQTIQIPVVGDTTVEPDETFRVQLSNAIGALLDPAASLAPVTLSNDDQMPTLSLTANPMTEGNSGISNASITVSLSAASSQTITANYTATDGTARAGSDYQALSGVLIFAPGQTSQNISLPVLGDTTVEPDETVQISLSNPANAQLPANPTASLLIRNDDWPLISLTGTTLAEGDTGSRYATVALNLDQAPYLPVTFAYTTVDGTAQAGTDYTSTSGNLTFAPGQTRQTIDIPVLGDGTVENDEAFRLQLSNPLNSRLSASTATVTVSNDDIPRISLSGTTVIEGNSGTSNATVTVSLDKPSNKTVTVDYATQDGTATAGSDYTATRGTLIFNPGETSKTITVGVTGDEPIEADETLRLVLSSATNAILANSTATLTIQNDDTRMPAVTLSSDKTSLLAGETATLTFTFNVMPSSFTARDISVTGATLDGLSVDASGKIYTARLTPVAANAWTGSISVAASRYTDKAGNAGMASNTLNFTGDTLVPTLSSSTPTDNATDIAPNSNLVLNFSEPVQAGTGNIILSNGTDTRTLNSSDTSQVSFSGNSVTLNPSAGLQGISNYAVQLASGVILDVAGNAYVGIVDASTLNFTTEPVNMTDSTERTTVGSRYQGTIDRIGDVDWIGITLDGGTAYEVNLYGADSASGTLADPAILGIYEASGRLQANSGGDDSGGTLDDGVAFQPGSSGLYYVAVSGYGDSTGTYALALQTDPFYGV
jgi:hypothetical protein